MAINHRDPRLGRSSRISIRKPKVVKTLTIDRNRWLNGDAESPTRLSLLRSSEGNMCCLGFYCKRLGMQDSEITAIATPKEIVGLIPSAGAWLVDGKDNSNQTYELTDVNDSHSISRKEREASIKGLFKAQGVDVRFTGRYPTRG